MNRLIDLELKSQTVWLSCPWDAQIIATIKTIPGRDFDKRTRRWGVPLSEVATVIELLEPLHFRFTPRMRDWWAEHRADLPASDARADVVEVDPDDGFTVSRLNEAARRVLVEHFGDEVWVIAEVDGYDRNKAQGHAYLQLVERSAAGSVIASINTVMFAATRQRIERALPDDVPLRDGARLRLRGKIELYAPKGSFQFVVDGVDVEWSVGARKRKRDQVLERLESDGLARKNLELPMPLLPLRVGLITATGSDAYNDFVHELERSGYGFDVVFHPAKMQGRDAESTIVDALRWFARRHEAFDVIVVTRGGGSRGDLGAFDSYPIGRAVCELGVKVVAGIGHHRDRSVLDFVATSEKTPTAAAQALVGCLETAFARVDMAARSVTQTTLRAVEAQRQRVDRAAGGVERNASRRLTAARRRVDQAAVLCERRATSRLTVERRRVELAGMRVAERGVLPLERARARIDRAATEVDRRAARAIANGRLQLEHIEAKLRLADPRRVIERGYAVLRDRDGRVIADASALVELDEARVEMRDGVVRVRPEEAIDE